MNMLTRGGLFLAAWAIRLLRWPIGATHHPPKRFVLAWCAPDRTDGCAALETTLAPHAPVVTLDRTAMTGRSGSVTLAGPDISWITKDDVLLVDLRDMPADVHAIISGLASRSTLVFVCVRTTERGQFPPSLWMYPNMRPIHYDTVNDLRGRVLSAIAHERRVPHAGSRHTHHLSIRKPRRGRRGNPAEGPGDGERLA